MQIVIDIPKDVYNRTVFYREFKNLNDCVTIIKALENGTPLPKHHGRLIDADKLTESILCKTFGLRNVDIENEPTIVEADKESGER